MHFGDLRGILQYVPQFQNKTFVIAIDGAFFASLANGLEEVGEPLRIVVHIKGLPKLLAITVDKEHFVHRFGVVDSDDEDLTIVLGLGEDVGYAWVTFFEDVCHCEDFVNETAPAIAFTMATKGRSCRCS